MGKGVAAIVTMCAVLGLSAAPASAAVQIGYTESSNTACAAANTVDFQTLSPAGNGYVVPFNGVITVWWHDARQITGAVLQMEVGRPLSPLSGPASFLAVGESNFENVSAGGFFGFLTRVPVLAGDRLGLATGSNAAGSPPACNTTASTLSDEVYEGSDFAVGTSNTLNPFNNFRLNISALVEPDNDGDGYGDESQDACPTNSGTTGACPAAAAAARPAAVTPRKRCKKKKGSSAVAAKKCKKK